MRPLPAVLLAVAALAVLQAVEGASLAGLPLALTHVLVLPALYAPRGGLPALIGLAYLDWSLGYVPLGAAVSTVATIWFLFELVRDDVNIESPTLAVLILPAAELVRQFWFTIFATLYGLDAAPDLPVGHLLGEPLLGLALFFAVRRLFSRAALRAAAAQERTVW